MPNFSLPMTNGNDSFTAPQSGPYVGNWSIDGLAGNDTIVGWNGAGTFQGGNGNDYLLGGGGGDLLYGGIDDDNLWGEQGNNTLNGGDGHDYLYGGSGDDDLYGGGALQGEASGDYLYGGSGNDWYFHDFSLGGVTVINDTNGGELNNFDSIILTGNSTSLTMKWGNDRSSLFIYQNGGMDGDTLNNGIKIQGMLTNTGLTSSGTIETIFINGQWLDFAGVAQDGWNKTFPG